MLFSLIVLSNSGQASDPEINSSHLCPLRGRYSSAPRGARTTCWSRVCTFCGSALEPDDFEAVLLTVATGIEVPGSAAGHADLAPPGHTGRPRRAREIVDCCTSQSVHNDPPSSGPPPGAVPAPSRAGRNAPFCPGTGIGRPSPGTGVHSTAVARQRAPPLPVAVLRPPTRQPGARVPALPALPLRQIGSHQTRR